MGVGENDKQSRCGDEWGEGRECAGGYLAKCTLLARKYIGYAV